MCFLDNDLQRAAWVDLLAEYAWGMFATLTFTQPQHDPTRAFRMFSAWLRRWHFDTAAAHGLAKRVVRDRRDGYGRLIDQVISWRGTFPNLWKKKRGLPVFVVGIEQHKNGSNHLHAVIQQSRLLPELQRSEGWRLWKEQGTIDGGGYGLGFARIEPPQNQDDVRGYVSKYVTKDGELHLSESFQRSCFRS